MPWCNFYDFQGLISGSAELREQAALGLGELIEVTSEKALREFVIPITGYAVWFFSLIISSLPSLVNDAFKNTFLVLIKWKLDMIVHVISSPLIRIIGDRFPWQVKSAILSTLSIMIQKGGMALKPFLPQLQTTFVKCLQDNTRSVHQNFSIQILATKFVSWAPILCLWSIFYAGLFVQVLQLPLESLVLSVQGLIH